MANVKEFSIFQRDHLYDLLWAQATNSVRNLELERSIAKLISKMDSEDIASVREQVAQMMSALNS